ncbi:MAG: SAM-dependent chlorinase/fluorinase [Longimonas sp.]|uniref:SAM hydrolase/SAM-dependent halogenase family protein n=1 Tax=Longimonas sp. TaxID=2039626 RepID=UPI0033465487
MITLTTDFGTKDAYVSAMKGVMFGIAPEARLVDITHGISPQDVMEAAFVLQSAVPHFPDGTVHLVVVDPGVGSERRAIALRHANQWFVGPDNGVFSLLLNQEPPDAIVELDNPAFWRTDTPSATFHGRDIFAPAAAHLEAGASLHEIGTPVDSLSSLRWALPMVVQHTIEGWVVHIDRFGNCITNIEPGTVTEAFPDLDSEPLHAPTPPAPVPLKCYVGSTILDAIHPTYASVAEGDPVVLFGSSGFLEVAVNGGHAAQLLNIRKSDAVKLLPPSLDTNTPNVAHHAA